MNKGHFTLHRYSRPSSFFSCYLDGVFVCLYVLLFGFSYQTIVRERSSSNDGTVVQSTRWSETDACDDDDDHDDL